MNNILQTNILVNFTNEEHKSLYKKSEDKLHNWNKILYHVIGLESYSETGAGFVILINDIGEIWWVDNRHVIVNNVDDFTSRFYSNTKN